jgi:hypothetical protein
MTTSCRPALVGVCGTRFSANRAGASVSPFAVPGVWLRLLAEPEPLADLRHEAGHGATYAPCDEKGNAARARPRKPPSSSPQAPRKGMAGEQTPPSRSNLFRPTCLQVGCEWSGTYPLALSSRRVDVTPAFGRDLQE